MQTLSSTLLFVLVAVIAGCAGEGVRGEGALEVAGAPSVIGAGGAPVSSVAADVVRVRSTVVEYGTSVQGRTLWLVRIEGPDPGAGVRRPAALLMGVSQGGEHLPMVDVLPGVLAAARLSGDQTRSGDPYELNGVQAFLDAGGVIYAVPVVNPDGDAALTYVNANGVNLNRDWTDQSQPEVRTLAAYLEAEADAVDLRFVVDYHIGIPRLLVPRADSPTPLPVGDFVEHMRFHDLLPRTITKPPISLYDSIRDLYDDSPACAEASDCRFSPSCDTEWNCGCLHSPEWEGGRCIMEPVDDIRIERFGLSNDYFYETYGAAAFIYEADVASDATNVEDHAVWWDRSLGYIATGSFVAVPAVETIPQVLGAARPAQRLPL